VSKNNGVLFENDLVQIGVKSEFRQNLGRLNLFYGNKTVNQFHSFMPEVRCNGPLSNHILYAISYFKLLCYTLCPKKTCDYIFYNNFNNKCPITIIFGIVSSKSMRH